jgi:hypothetical protein
MWYCSSCLLLSKFKKHQTVIQESEKKAIFSDHCNSSNQKPIALLLAILELGLMPENSSVKLFYLYNEGILFSFIRLLVDPLCPHHTALINGILR